MDEATFTLKNASDRHYTEDSTALLAQHQPVSAAALLDIDHTPKTSSLLDLDHPGNENGSDEALWQMMVVQFTEDGDSAVTLIQATPDEQQQLQITSEEMDIVWGGDSESEVSDFQETPVHGAKTEKDEVATEKGTQKNDKLEKDCKEDSKEEEDWSDDNDDDEEEEEEEEEKADDDDDLILEAVTSSPFTNKQDGDDTSKKKNVHFTVEPISYEDLSKLGMVADLTQPSQEMQAMKAITEAFDISFSEDKIKVGTTCDVAPSTPKTPNGYFSDDSYYDTNSSTSSNAPLLAKAGRRFAPCEPIPEKTTSVENVPDCLYLTAAPATGPCVEARPVHPEFSTGIGKALLTETLEQVKKSLEEIPGYTDKSQEMNADRLKKTYLRNLFVLSLAIMLVHAPFYALRNMQSSINHHNGLGLISMAFTGVTYITGCILGASLINKIRPKWTLLMGLSGFLVYILANFHATFYTLLPATALLGFTMANLWVAQGTYLTSIAISYAALSAKKHDTVLVLFNGFFLFFLQISQIVGNLVCSTVLKIGMGQTDKEVTHIDDQLEPIAYLESPFWDDYTETALTTPDSTLMYQNMTNIRTLDFHKSHPTPFGPELWNTSICGCNYCHSYTIDHASFDINPVTFSALLGIFAGFCILGMFTLGFFLDKLDVIFQRNTMKVSKQLLGLAKLHKQRRMLLFIPLYIFLGAQVAMVYGDVTKAYVTCPLGLHMVGYVMVCFGACDSIMAFSMGLFQKYLGRKIILYSGAVLHLALIIVMYSWRPSTQEHTYVFLMVGAIGICDAIWQTQACSMCGLLFKEREAAFAALRVYESLGFTLAIGVAQFLCMDIKLILLGLTLLVSIVSYTALEYVVLKQDGKYPPVLV